MHQDKPREFDRIIDEPFRTSLVRNVREQIKTAGVFPPDQVDELAAMIVRDAISKAAILHRNPDPGVIRLENLPSDLQRFAMRECQDDLANRTRRKVQETRPSHEFQEFKLLLGPGFQDRLARAVLRKIRHNNVLPHDEGLADEIASDAIGETFVYWLALGTEQRQARNDVYFRRNAEGRSGNILRSHRRRRLLELRTQPKLAVDVASILEHWDESGSSTDTPIMAKLLVISVRSQNKKVKFAVALANRILQETRDRVENTVRPFAECLRDVLETLLPPEDKERWRTFLEGLREAYRLYKQRNKD